MSIFKNVKPITLTLAEERSLIATVRESRAYTTVTTEGEEVTKYDTTPEQEDALWSLTLCYISDIRRAARTAKVIDRDDAEGVAYETFIKVVRTTEKTNDRLAGFVSKIMVNEVMNADAEASGIRIPPDTLRRYMNIVRDAGSVNEAYALCEQDAETYMHPMTFIAVVRALNAESTESVKAEGGEREIEYLPNPEDEITDREFVKWLLTLVPEVQEQIVRLAYGFTDVPTALRRIKGGYPQDAPKMSDKEISECLRADGIDLSRATVQRRHTDALNTMRAAIKKEASL